MRKKNAEYFEKIQRYIEEYREVNDVAPSIREIEAALGISKATISRYLTDLRNRGVIEYTCARRIVTEESKKMRNETIKVPVLGAVSCGIPKFAEENIEEYVRLPVALFGHGNFFILRANGDSMIEADIDNGDLVLVRQQDSASAGEIVVALMKDEATLKRYYPEPENHRVRLHSENATMDDIYVPTCLIQGVAVKVLKDLL